MSLWRSPKPVIAQVHGWCVGGGSEMALCADIVIASEDAPHRNSLLADVGLPPRRRCGSTGWGSRGAKELALTGHAISGSEASDISLHQHGSTLEELEKETRQAGRNASRAIPASQLAAMKLVVNQAYDNMGLSSTQLLGSVMDSMMRNTPEARAFVGYVRRARASARWIAEHDAPFSNYSQAEADGKPDPGQRRSCRARPRLMTEIRYVDQTPAGRSAELLGNAHPRPGRMLRRGGPDRCRRLPRDRHRRRASHFEVLVRFTHVDPWEGLDAMRAALPGATLRAGMRTNGVVGMAITPDSVIELWLATLAKHGIGDVLDPRLPAQHGEDQGGRSDGAHARGGAIPAGHLQRMARCIRTTTTRRSWPSSRRSRRSSRSSSATRPECSASSGPTRGSR